MIADKVSDMSAADDRYIMIAEDNSGDIALIRLALAEEGVNLDMAVHNDGEQAVRFLNLLDRGEKPCPLLVILDLNLPKVHGRDILKRIRQSPVCGKVPVVVFSSSDAARDKESVANLGASMYVRKPSNLTDFLRIGKLIKDFLPAEDQDDQAEEEVAAGLEASGSGVATSAESSTRATSQTASAAASSEAVSGTREEPPDAKG